MRDANMPSQVSTVWRTIPVRLSLAKEETGVNQFLSPDNKRVNGHTIHPIVWAVIRP